MTSRLLFVDPGTNCPGVAIFDGERKRLFAARYFEGSGFHDDIPRVAELASEVATWVAPHGPFSRVGFEWPQIYRAGFNSNRLLPLALFAGALTAFLWPYITPDCEFPLVRTAQWKGQKKKKVTARMVLDRFEPGELDAMEEAAEFMRDLLDAESKDRDLRHPTNNTMDAIGIGMFMLGRFGVS
jgi:hypothetical protein